MRFLNIFLYEFYHFRKNRSKVITYLIFVFACVYSIYNGFSLQHKQTDTILHIQKEQNDELKKVIDWFEQGISGPKDRNWVNIKQPHWAFRYIPSYTIKKPSPLLPLGIGQAEQYAYYKEISNWSSTFDPDMMEEISNPERLVNGSIDFSFLIIFLLPILLIILTYNISGLEKDLKFEKLIAIQSTSLSKWILFRFLFYVILLLLTVLLLIFSVFIINQFQSDFYNSISNLIILSASYILLFSLIFYLIIIFSNSSSSIAFKMISIWLLFCVILPGGIHQYASMKYPTNYMTDFLDVNRKESYDVFKLPVDQLYDKLVNIYPDLNNTKHGMDSVIDNGIIRNTISAIINEMNKDVISKIEEQNNSKNEFIKSTYWFNPISYFLNEWNAITSTDYNSYYNFRQNIQSDIDTKMKLLVFDCWNQKKVNKSVYENYLKQLDVNYK